MKYKHFGDFVTSLGTFGNRRALTLKPFLREERTSYAELRRQAHQTANYLISLDIEPGDRIMIAAPNSPSWVKLFLGAQLAGIIVVPVDVISSQQTVEHYIERTKPKLIFRGRHVLAGLDKTFDTEILERLPELIASQPDKPPHGKLSGDIPALIVFTSGTTADPKGVVLTQRNVLSNIEAVHTALAIDSNWRFLSILPLSHMYELTGGCLTILSGGASIYYVPVISPSAINKALRNYRITSMLAVPQIASLFLKKIQQTAAETGQAKLLNGSLKVAAVLPRFARRALFHKVHAGLGGHLQFIATGGAAMPIDVTKAWERMGVKILQGYGLTETSPVLAMNTLTERRLDSPGRVVAGTKLRIADNSEIEAKGPSIFHEYWHNAAATKAVFTPDGWFKTGDMGELRDGWLHIKGRERFMIVLASGLKVFPEDVEFVAKRQAELTDVCVIPLKRGDGEVVRAVLISKASNASIEKAIEAANAKLESFQHISDWIRWPEDDFPRTRLLKVDRRKVEAWANETAAAQKDELAKKEKQADPLVTIIRQVLDEPHANVADKATLASLGLDSLRRLTLVSLIEERMNVSVSEADITQTTTVAGLRKLIDKGSAATVEAPRPSWPYNPIVRVIGNTLRETIGRGVLRIWLHIRVEGRDKLTDLDTPAIFIFNHVDNFDAPVLYQALPHAIRSRLAIATADDVMRDHKMIALGSRLGCAGFSFARTAPFMPSLEYAGKLLDQGWNIAIAPEGKISRTDKLQPFKSGIGLLAVETGVPIVPVKTIGLFGTVPLHENWPQKRSNVTVRIGEPMRFPPETSYDAATQTLRQAIEKL